MADDGGSSECLNTTAIVIQAPHSNSDESAACPEMTMQSTTSPEVTTSSSNPSSPGTVDFITVITAVVVPLLLGISILLLMVTILLTLYVYWKNRRQNLSERTGQVAFRGASQNVYVVNEELENIVAMNTKANETYATNITTNKK